MSSPPKRIPITKEIIAEEINFRLKRLNISENDLNDLGVSRQKIGSVLRNKKVFRDNYTIDTFIEVLNAANINIYFTN